MEHVLVMLSDMSLNNYFIQCGGEQHLRQRIKVVLLSQQCGMESKRSVNFGDIKYVTHVEKKKLFVPVKQAVLLGVNSCPA